MRFEIIRGIGKFEYDEDYLFAMVRMALVVLALFFLVSIGSVSAAEPETFTITVDSNNLRFSPSTITIDEGDSVQFLWSGEALAHNAVEESGVFDSGDTSRDVDYTFTFEIGTAGEYNFFCEPHESVGMTGMITVNAVEIPDPEPNPESESVPGFSLLILLVAFVGAANWY